MALLMMSDAEFTKMMRKLNIVSGDIVYIDSKLTKANLASLNNFLYQLINYLGDSGSIVMSLAGHNENLNKVYQLKSVDEVKELFKLKYDGDTYSLYAKDKLALHLLKLAGSEVSNNPFSPYVAYGKYAKLLVGSQAFDFGDGFTSPLAILEQLKAKALLINHDIISFKFNNYIFETSVEGVIRVNGGILNNEYKGFLSKSVDTDMIKQMLTQKDFKKMFYYAELNDIDFLGVNISDYVEYGQKYMKEFY